MSFDFEFIPSPAIFTMPNFTFHFLILDFGIQNIPVPYFSIPIKNNNNALKSILYI